MSKSTKSDISAKAGIQKSNGLVPELRFPEYRDADDWKRMELGEIASFYKGKGLPKSKIIADGVNLCIHYGQLFTEYSEVITEVKSRTNMEGGFLSIENDVLMPTSDVTPSGLAKACSVKSDGIILGGDILVIRTDKSNINGEFLSRYIRSREKKVLELVTGSTVYHLYASAIEKLQISIPSIDEQQKIADCLSSLDDLISAHTQKHQALKSYKKGLMQNLFPAEGKTTPALRFPEFSSREGWHKTRLIDVADKKVKWSFIGGPFGSNLKSSDYVSEGVRIIQLQNIGDAEFMDEYKIFTSEEKANELLSNNIYPGDIILSKMGDPVGRACLIPDNHSRYVMCSDGIRLVVDETSFSKYFIYVLINSSWFRALVEKTATGSTRKRIGLDDLKKLLLIVPTLGEQQKIAKCLSFVDELITVQAQKIEDLKAHKKGLMQQLFPSLEGVGT